MSQAQANLDAQASRFEEVAAELEKALAHARIAARHFRAAEVPRACAHTLATQGHLRAVNSLIDQICLFHRTAAQIE